VNGDATVTIQNPVSHYTQTVQADGQGNFAFDNVPCNNYHLSVVASGVQTGGQDLDIRTPVPAKSAGFLFLLVVWRRPARR
jgi:hypothetical protein